MSECKLDFWLFPSYDSSSDEREELPGQLQAVTACPSFSKRMGLSLLGGLSQLLKNPMKIPRRLAHDCWNSSKKRITASETVPESEASVLYTGFGTATRPNVK